MGFTYNLSELTLIEATPEQVIITNRNTYVEWGAPHLTLDEYISRERILSSLPFTSKNFTVWILVPRSTPETTTNILSSCETFIRPALVQSSQKQYCYSIASVFTPPEHRKNGYASYMMEMLGKKLKENFQGVGFSFLYSDIGPKFYSRLGWKVFGHKEIQFNIENTNLNDITSDTANTISLSCKEVVQLTKYDCSLIENEIGINSAKYGVVVLPTFECFEWLFARSNFYAKVKDLREPNIWGVKLTNGEDQIIGFVIWTYNFQEEILQILRIRSLNTNVTKSLIKRAKLYASHYNFKKVTVWNPDLKLFTDPSIIEGGELVERTKSLPSLAWYHHDKGLNENEDDVEWILNENYAWC
ncbi:2641_t:CDS:2 [Funneliformis geosporum]|uniref:12287_t:CDS:1 n=1 Tax=Funneliformis geosporum TaxID=1117311 RepID=A0A9W4WXQ4_9GLOM|nr:2641_t:CDS:2 [Funneliformis geosporum]CAI2180029.1 12287_t:CDS:2 [Funneliformis geosporum]